MFDVLTCALSGGARSTCRPCDSRQNTLSANWTLYMFASFGADGQLTTTTRRPSFCAELPSRWRLSPPPLNTCWFGVHSRRPGCRQQFNRRKEFSTDRLCRPTWSHRLFCPFQLASDHGRFHSEVGVRRLFCHDFPAFHSITLVAPRTVRASRADHFRCFLLRRPTFNRSRLRLHLLPSVCFGFW